MKSKVIQIISSTNGVGKKCLTPEQAKADLQALHDLGYSDEELLRRLLDRILDWQAPGLSIRRGLQ